MKKLTSSFFSDTGGHTKICSSHVKLCFVRSKHTYTFQGAINFCKSVNGYLADIQSHAEQNLSRDAVRETIIFISSFVHWSSTIIHFDTNLDLIRFIIHLFFPFVV